MHFRLAHWGFPFVSFWPCINRMVLSFGLLLNTMAFMVLPSAFAGRSLLQNLLQLIVLKFRVFFFNIFFFFCHFKKPFIVLLFSFKFLFFLFGMSASVSYYCCFQQSGQALVSDIYNLSDPMWVIKGRYQYFQSSPVMNTISFELVCVQLGKSFTDSSDNSVFEMPQCSSLIFLLVHHMWSAD